MGSSGTPAAVTPIISAVLKSQRTDPQNSVLVGLEDKLYLLYWSSIPFPALMVTMRVLNPDGRISLSSYTIITNNLRAGTPVILPAGEGLLLGALINAFSSVVVRRGQIYAQLMLARGGLAITTQFTQYLCGGYVTNETPIGFPFSPYDPSLSGRGNLRAITGTAPAPGVELSEVVPSGAVWKLHSIRMLLTTDATAPQRTNALLYFNETGGAFFQTGQSFLLGPTSGANFCYYTGAQNLTETTLGLSTAPLPEDVLLTSGCSFQTRTGGFAAGDQYGVPEFLVEEWLQQ